MQLLLLRGEDTRIVKIFQKVFYVENKTDGSLTGYGASGIFCLSVACGLAAVLALTLSCKASVRATARDEERDDG